MGVGIQSPIPLIYLAARVARCRCGWDSVTYPLDILVGEFADALVRLGFSHLSP